jgi:hypothetical protein
MTEALDRLARLLNQVPPRLVDISDEEASRPPAAGKWCVKQIVGHLIDSASNNQQRWVRALAAPGVAFPPYEQESWVSSQAYATERWADLVNLWLLYNRHLLHVLRSIPPDKLNHMCTVGNKAPATIEWLAVDYVRHMEHHLAQVFDCRAAASEGV